MVQHSAAALVLPAWILGTCCSSPALSSAWSSAGRSLLLLWLSVSHGTTCGLHGLALAFEVSCSGTAEIQAGLFKIINPVFYRVSNSNSAIKLRENGLQELLLSLCEGITSRTDLFLLTSAKANVAFLGFVSFRLWRSWCREQRVAATRRRKDKLS